MRNSDRFAITASSEATGNLSGVGHRGKMPLPQALARSIWACKSAGCAKWVVDARAEIRDRRAGTGLRQVISALRNCGPDISGPIAPGYQQLGRFLRMHGIAWTRTKPEKVEGQKICKYFIPQAELDELEGIVALRGDDDAKERWYQDRNMTATNRLYPPEVDDGSDDRKVANRIR